MEVSAGYHQIPNIGKQWYILTPRGLLSYNPELRVINFYDRTIKMPDEAIKVKTFKFPDESVKAIIESAKKFSALRASLEGDLRSLVDIAMKGKLR